MKGGLTLLFGAILLSHQLAGQVVFSPRGNPTSTSKVDTTAPTAQAKHPAFRVSCFDSGEHTAANKSADELIHYTRIDSLLGQAADTLFGEIEHRKLIATKSAGWLQYVPAIPPVRYLSWQDYRVSSRFGWRVHPVGGDAQLHNGLDLPQPAGTPVYATADGVVKWVIWEPDGLGLGVCIEHPTGYQSIYGHLSTHAVQRGDDVRRGELIGRVGNTGRSTRPHLHYTVRYQGKPVDPARYCFLWVKLARNEWLRSAGPKVSPAQETRGNRGK